MCDSAVETNMGHNFVTYMFSLPWMNASPGTITTQSPLRHEFRYIKPENQKPFPCMSRMGEPVGFAPANNLLKASWSGTCWPCHD